MKIGIFTETFYPEISGVTTACLELKEGLENAGHDVYVFTVTNENADPKWDKDNNVFRVFSVPFVLFNERRIGLPVLSNAMSIIKKLQLDLIHTQSEFSLGTLGRKAAKKFGIPMVHTYHTMYEEYLHYLKLPKNDTTVKFVGKLIKKFTKRASAIITPSQKTKDSLLTYDIKPKIYVIPTGIDLNKYSNIDQKEVDKIKKKYNITPESICLISVSRLSNEKRLPVLLAYFAKTCEKYPDRKIRLLVVGDGPQKEILEKQVLDLGISNKVTFAGYVDWESIQNYYHAADIFVSASKSETQGLTYLEALAANIPILAQEDPCLDYFLQDGKNGKSFDDQKSFTSSLNFLVDQIQNNPDFKPAENLYTRQDFINKVISVYNGAIIQTKAKQKHSILA